MKRLLTIVLLVLLNFQVSGQIGVVSDTTEIMGLALSIPVGEATFTGPMSLSISAQEIILTHCDYEYISFYNAERKVQLGRKKLCDNEWEFLVFEDYVQSANDSHNFISMGICPNDGTIHLSFDHHGDTLNYRVSVKNLASLPGEFDWQADLFSTTRNYLTEGDIITKVTYPGFFQTADGNLSVYFRVGTSGNGDGYLAFYDGRNSSWNNVHKFISASGVYKDPYLADSSFSRNPYPCDFVYDNNNVLHASWVWREGSQSNYNHDIAYAWSPDYGNSWYNNDSLLIGAYSDTNQILINYHSLGLHVWDIDSRYGMINNGGQTLDQYGQPHLILRHRIEPIELDTLVFSNCNDGSLFHYWRSPNGVWNKQELPFCGSRAKLYADNLGNLYMCYMGSNKIKIVSALGEDEWQNWELTYQGENYCRKNEPLADRKRLSQHGILSFVSQEFYGDEWAGDIFVTDLKFDRPHTSSIQVDVESDTYVRAGSYANENYGSETSLVVKDVSDADYDRKIYLRFDLERITNLRAENIISAELILDIKTVQHDFSDQLYDLYFVVDDSWNELDMNWNNAPANELLIEGIQGDSKRMKWDITEIIEEEYHGDATLSLCIQQNEEGVNPIIHFYAREFHSSGLGPRIELKVESSCLQDFENIVTSIDQEFLEEKVIVYPNPVKNGKLNITNLEQYSGEELRLSVWNMLGQELLIEVFKQDGSSTHAIEIDELRSGFYVVSLQSINGKSTSIPFSIVD